MKESVFKNALFTILSKNYPLSIGYAKHAPAIDDIAVLVCEAFGAELEVDVINVAPVQVEEEIKLTEESTDEIAPATEDVPTAVDEPVSDGSIDDSEAVDESDEK